MTKNTGMTAEDAKAGKTAKLPPKKATKVNKMLKAEKSKPAPTKTVQHVKDARKGKATK